MSPNEFGTLMYKYVTQDFGFTIAMDSPRSLVESLTRNNQMSPYTNYLDSNIEREVHRSEKEVERSERA